MDDRSAQNRPLDVLNARGLTAKREYVRGLEQRHDDEALSLLVECLCDESWYLRDLAEQAFLRLGDAGAAVLLPLLEDGLWYTRSSTARVLGRMGHRAAVPGLVRLAEDANATVAQSAREALIAIAGRGGASRIAHAIHRLPAEVQRQRIEELQRLDHAAGERIQRLLRREEIMSIEEADTLHDESAVVRASEEGLEWEVLTGPPKDRSPHAGGSPGGEPR
ncbi:MAG TPA: HEAT repeat domain-containing protein [Candidatus Sulfotelmatobacter sp.]|nr:HEAT repeat domain-containing protein [Candidatus Sulfotelmatobacter sp.]